MAHHPEKARGVCRNGFCTNHHRGGTAWGLQVHGGGFGECVDQPVGSPVGSGEASSSPLLDFATGLVGLVRKNSPKLATGDQDRDVLTDHVRHSLLFNSSQLTSWQRKEVSLS